MIRVAYLGNFQPEHSTESHVARSFEDAGHHVTRIQEGVIRAVEVPAFVEGHDLFLWTQTYGLAVSGGTITERFTMLNQIWDLGVPSVGYHLDRWWGLDRADQLPVEPFFRCDFVCTADGGHDAGWKDLGVNHYWFPPGVAHFECEPASPNRMYQSDVAFVGSWRGGYHAEWQHRPQLVTWLRASYGQRCRFWPARIGVRGEELRRLYASTKVNVGDSCLVPDEQGPAIRYWSDRIPETLGRGGFLLHPWVEGIDEHFTDGEQLRCWPLGDWGELKRLIDYYVANDDERRQIANAGRLHVLANHTYTRRIEQLIAMLTSTGRIIER